MKKASSIQARKRQDWIIYGLFVFPAVFFFALVVLVPFAQGIYFSFTNWNGLMTGSQTFVGFKNYLDAFADEKFRYSAIKTLGYGVCNFLVINLVSFCCLYICDFTCCILSYVGCIFLLHVVCFVCIIEFWGFACCFVSKKKKLCF